MWFGMHNRRVKHCRYRMINYEIWLSFWIRDTSIKSIHATKSIAKYIANFHSFFNPSLLKASVYDCEFLCPWWIWSELNLIFSCQNDIFLLLCVSNGWIEPHLIPISSWKCSFRVNHAKALRRLEITKPFVILKSKCRKYSLLIKYKSKAKTKTKTMDIKRDTKANIDWT